MDVGIDRGGAAAEAWALRREGADGRPSSFPLRQVFLPTSFVSLRCGGGGAGAGGGGGGGVTRHLFRPLFRPSVRPSVPSFLPPFLSSPRYSFTVGRSAARLSLGLSVCLSVRAR